MVVAVFPMISDKSSTNRTSRCPGTAQIDFFIFPTDGWAREPWSRIGGAHQRHPVSQRGDLRGGGVSGFGARDLNRSDVRPVGNVTAAATLGRLPEASTVGMAMLRARPPSASQAMATTALPATAAASGNRLKATETTMQANASKLTPKASAYRCDCCRWLSLGCIGLELLGAVSTIPKTVAPVKRLLRHWCDSARRNLL